VLGTGGVAAGEAGEAVEGVSAGKLSPPRALPQEPRDLWPWANSRASSPPLTPGDALLAAGVEDSPAKLCTTYAADQQALSEFGPART
jgi:hypothetical protein